MARSVKSYDVFDTLIARRSVDPRPVLAHLEAQVGMPGLAQARLAADQQLGSLGRAYTLWDIWQQVGRTLGLEATAIERLYRQEIQLDHEQTIPIVENLALVKDGDLLVSDTYLPPDLLLSLLRKAGLERTVALITSNDGKFRGWIWPKLLQQFRIEEHFGDNVHSDGRTASEAGIKAIIYTGAKRTAIEQVLVDQGWETLANLIREVRLANPFPTARPQERSLWNLSCELNFPLLLFASLALEQSRSQSNAGEVLFVSRDGLLWHRLYQSLFPDRPARYFYASRRCLLKPSASFRDYVQATWRPDSLIVDLFSTGASWAAFFARLRAKAACFFIGLVDNYRYLPNAPAPQEWLRIEAVFKNSDLGQALNKNVEMLNYAPHPVVEDVVWLPDHGPVPILAEQLEYERAWPEAAHQAFRACLDRLAHYPKLTGGGSLSELIKLFVRWIGNDAQLPAIYPGHQAADLAYLQQILGER